MKKPKTKKTVSDLRVGDLVNHREIDTPATIAKMVRQGHCWTLTLSDGTETTLAGQADLGGRFCPLSLA